MSKKAAFTMVELIFVIVILGILAAVAVPRLNASREDAKAKVALANLRMLYDDILTYYAAQGEIPKDFDFRKITSVPLKLSGSRYEYEVDGAECLRVIADDDDCVVLWHLVEGPSSACQKALADSKFIAGDDRYARSTNWCAPNTTMSHVSLPDATLKSGKTHKGVILHLGEGSVEW